MKENILKTKSFDFAVLILRLSNNIKVDHREFDVSRQLIRSGTAIGAHVRNAEQAESKKDFIHKLSIALKEANETLYWLELLEAAGMLNKNDNTTAASNCEELIRLLTASIITSKSRYMNNQNIKT